MANEDFPRVRSLAVRIDKWGPMHEVNESEVVVGRGLKHDPRGHGRRGVTLLAWERWQETLAELGVDLPWHTRRANILVEGADLAAWIGRSVRIGRVEIHIYGETRPCGRMDELHSGLKAALAPDCRGGVHGSVVKGGILRVGDRIEVV